MDRRVFTKTLLGATGSALMPSLLQRINWPSDVRITRITGFHLFSERSKLAGKNSRLGVHGERARDRMVRIYTNTGQEGLGFSLASRRDLRKLLGRHPLDYYDSENTEVTALGVGTMPLWDLAGKLHEQPVYALLGAEGDEQVRVYDGSIYFADLLPQYQDRPFDRIKEEIDMGLEAGHRTFKVKIGRGAIWMERQAGDQRDVEVLKTIRRHAGSDVAIGVDANNAYDLPRTKELLASLPDYNFDFIEEMFPEDVDKYLELKQFIRENGWDTLIADGETQREVEPLIPFMKANAIDVYQLDMRQQGIEGILREAALARKHGDGLIAPHNWGSLIGYYMQLHVGRAVPNFYMAEHDPLHSDVLVADGYRLEEGYAHVPDAPGFGLTLDEERFEQEARVLFDLEA